MSTKQTYKFETEVKQLLKLVIHSLYSNRDIFLRELISNASDAIEKLRYESIKQPALNEGDSDYCISVDFDADKQTITITDNGIGMSESEIIENLGTIANSGTKKFLEQLTGDNAKDSQLIGQFGVGFYSAFVVADKVTVNSRKAGLAADKAVSWQSTADGEYTLEQITKAKRGTEIVLHIKDDEKEVLDRFYLKNLVSKYSDYISAPIKMLKVEHSEDGKETVSTEWETINSAKALWMRPKADVTDEEYKSFYKHISHDYADPSIWSHNRVEGNLEYTSLLYIPEHKPFDLWDRDRKHGLQLYVQRVFIMENSDLLPSYLRFVKGLIDSSDLPLNVSREILQHNKVIDKIKKATTKKVLDMLSKLAESDVEKYQKFWVEFGQVIKEGLAEDTDNKDKIASLLRFASTHQDTATQDVSLNEYIARMKDEQKYIYYITAESFNAAKHNPQLEVFRKKGIEVLLMSDRVDEWMVTYLSEFEGKTLKSVVKGDLGLDAFDNDEDKKAFEEKEKSLEKMIAQMKEALKDQVEDVRISKRLTDSPSCVVVNDYGMSLHMQKLMQEAGQAFMPGMGMKPILEINPEHRIVERLNVETDDERFADISTLLLDQALLTEGAKLEDPVRFVKLMNKYI